jgi:hypothetical protein
MTFPYQTGAIQSPPDTRDYPVRMRLASDPPPLPAAFRLTRMPRVLEQQRGSCVAASMSGVGMFNEIWEAGGASIADFEHWYDTLAIEQFGTQNDIGLYTRAALDSWRVKGPTVGGGYGAPEHFRIGTYFEVPGLTAARRVLYELRRPVLIVTRIAATWGETLPNGQLQAIDYYGPNTPDPWITALHQWWMWGWDDRPTLGNLLRNSWGTSFGKNGNAYMTNEQWDRSFIEAWHVESAI